MERVPSGEQPVPARVRVQEGVVHRDLQGEAVLLNLGTGLYFGLDEVGTRAWHLLLERGSVDAVVAQLLVEYDVEESRLRSDVETLVKKLVEQKLVTADE